MEGRVCTREEVEEEEVEGEEEVKEESERLDKGCWLLSNSLQEGGKEG